MKNKLFSKILFVLLAVVVAVGLAGIYKETKLPPSVRAFGDLIVDFGSPPFPPSPIFNFDDFKPGDCTTKTIKVTNNGVVPVFVAIKSTNITNSILSDVLSMIIKADGNPIYGEGSPTGPKTLSNFFTDSVPPDGLKLSLLPAGQMATYTFDVCFDINAGNDYQEISVVFDLIFGTLTADHIVINEVYYLVDGNHGMDSPKDRGIIWTDGKNVTVVIEGNGPGSTNIVTMSITNYCKLIQSNSSTINNSVIIGGNTGGNTASGNTGGSTSIVTGASNVLVNILNVANLNFGSCGCCNKLGLNDEWIELYNPTDHDISLKNWTLEDNSGIKTKINANKIIKAGGFALISKDARPWKFWDENPAAKKIELGKQIGDGLDNLGDHIFLNNPSGAEVDAVAWGDDTAVWNPAVPLVALGSSIERLVPGFDFDLVTDWEERLSPTPGD